MDKIKKILSPGSKQDDEAMYDTGSSQQPTGASGKLTGQGSHFASAQPSTDSAGYSLGKGPEALGGREESSLVNTSSAASALPEASASTSTQPLGSDGSGQAAIEETTTYSSHPLTTGDKTSSVIDPSSSDPTTFQKPESSAGVGSGVGPGAAETAARTAMYPGVHMPGEYPEDDSNPYSSSSLDPRVDSAGHVPTSSQSHTGRDAALGVGAGGAALGAYESTRQETLASSIAAPSTLTSTTNPTERHDTYGSAIESRGLDSAATTTESTGGQSVVGKVLGVLGLGGGAAAATHEASKDSAIDSATSTTTGAGSFRTPSQSGPPPAHHRKESIPTTAYPAGTLDSVRPIAGTGPAHHRKESIPTTAYPAGTLDSVRPIAGPIGQERPQGSSDRHYGRDAAIGGGAAGAVALGGHEFEKTRQQTSEVAAPPSGESSGPGTGLAATAGTTGAATSDAPTSIKQAATSDESHHYGRDAAIGGAAVGATGLAARKYQKNRSDPSATVGGAGQDSLPSGFTSTSQQYGNQPIAGQDAKGFSEHVDPRLDASGNARTGAGVAAVPVATEEEPKEEHHYGRDAALVTGGAAAAGYGAHEISEHDAEKAEKQRTKLQKQRTKDLEKEQKAHEKELKKEQKAQEKAEKKHEKEAAKQEKKEQKEQEKAEKQHQKEVAKEEKKQEKELQKEESQHDKEEEAVAAVGVGAAGTGAAHEYEKHHEPAAGGGLTGLAAADAADREAYNKQDRYTTAMADPGADPTVHKPSPTDSRTEQHPVRDAAVGGAGAAAIGSGAVAAEKHDAGDATGSGQRLSSLAAADETDRQAYGHKKKPSLFKRIFKRKKNEQTGESEDDENDYEDVPHDHPEAAAGAAGESPSTSQTHHHEEGELMKPSYNPFKKEVASDYGAVRDRI